MDLTQESIDLLHQSVVGRVVAEFPLRSVSPLTEPRLSQLERSVLARPRPPEVLHQAVRLEDLCVNQLHIGLQFLLYLHSFGYSLFQLFIGPGPIAQ